MYLELLSFAKSGGVKIATENMWNWDAEKDQSAFHVCNDSGSKNNYFCNKITRMKLCYAFFKKGGN